LLVVSANAAVNIQLTRHVQSNLRHVKGAMRNPEANDRNEQEALTREDIMEQNGQQQEVQQVQTSQLQQKQIVAQKQEPAFASERGVRQSSRASASLRVLGWWNLQGAIPW